MAGGVEALKFHGRRGGTEMAGGGTNPAGRRGEGVRGAREGADEAGDAVGACAREADVGESSRGGISLTDGPSQKLAIKSNWAFIARVFG
ncbi:hypothetical protein U1Q18_004035 [Sarracenia purpurea var. burkii]